MQTFGFTQVREELAGWNVDLEVEQERRIANLAEALVGWATAEHAWRPSRPHTEGTIAADVTGLATQLVTVTVHADMDAALWLEFARDGKWAWLYDVLVNHVDDIGAILAGGGAVLVDGEPIPNPDAPEEYEEARMAMTIGRRDSSDHGIRRRW